MKKVVIQDIEKKREQLQSVLDSRKSQLGRNKLGQFSTPIRLAREIMKFGISLSSDDRISFLDPAIGTGAFYSALCQVSENKSINRAMGFEIDPFYANPTIKLWADSDLKISIKDFTKKKPSPEFNLIVCNPPYVRHHHISTFDKIRLKEDSLKTLGINISGQAGLYCHFILHAHRWMASGCIAGWLIPSEFMDVNYGSALKEYLLKKVTLLHIHRFDPMDSQFSDAVVSSAIVWFRNSLPEKSSTVKFTFGGSMSRPQTTRLISSKDLITEKKWTRFPLGEIRSSCIVPTIGDFFKIMRGMATGANDYFILSEQDIKAQDLPIELFQPVLPGPRYLKSDVIESAENGYPEVENRQFLLNTSLSEDEIKARYPNLWNYLKMGYTRKVHEGYICRHRTHWYSQEKRPPAPIICTYMGRVSAVGSTPFRFIFNKSNAVVTNVYLTMYPTVRLLDILKNDKVQLFTLWKLLNQISIEHMIGEGRVYGGGLHKLEPKELAKVPFHSLSHLIDLRKSVKATELNLSI